MSRMSSCTLSPWWYPLAQLLPAPPPCLDRNTFSGLNRFLMSEFWMELMTLHMHCQPLLLFAAEWSCVRDMQGF